MWEEFKRYSWAFRYVTDEERFFSSLKEGLRCCGKEGRVKLSGNSFIRFMYNANGNHVEQPKCNIKLWFHEEVLLSATFIN